ncbi:MAG: hypothetical protein COA33_006145 [Fluviicola sp.]|nr:hypothetical protein [Fluviicola sp.]
MSEDVIPENESNLEEKEYAVQRDKARLNLVYVSMFSIVMLFAGLTSAYIVSMGDSFWLKFPLPQPFWISTCIIILSSITFMLATYAVKKKNTAQLKTFMSITFILGLLFVYFQFKGYGALVENGIHAANNHILVTEGKYGDYFEVKYKGDFIEINGNDFLIKGKKMNDAQLEEYQSFMSQFIAVSDKKPFKVNQYGKDFILYFESVPMTVDNSRLMTGEDEELKYLDRVRLNQLAINVRDLRGDFFVRGKMGKDFQIYYKGKELQYKDRQLQKDGQDLDNYLQLKSMEAADTASSYLYIITFLHLLHIIFTLFYLVKLLIRSFSTEIDSETTIKIKMGAAFWHFLGFLWLYLLLFLLFIH